MRKILATVLAMIMVCCIGVISYADGKNSIKANDSQVVPEDPVDLFIETLDKSLQAGTYMDENGEFFLAVTDLEKVNNLIEKANLTTKINVVEVEYSMAELEAARDNLFDNTAKEFDIQIVGIDPEINGLAVFTTDYTDTNTENISNHIETYINKTYNTKNFENSSTNEMNVVLYNNIATNVSAVTEELKDFEEKKSKALSTVKSGMYLTHAPWTDYESSLGWRLLVDGTLGYTTCGHHWSDDSDAYYQGNNLGQVENHFSTDENTDVSFIPSTVPFYGMRGDGKKITHAGSPVKGSTMIMDGARHYQNGYGRVKDAKITAINGVAYMEDKLHGKVTLTDLIVFDKQPLHGDSGSAIIQERDGKVILVGFNSCQYKGPNDGRKVWSYGGAVTWASVRDALGGSSVVKPTN